MLPFVFLDESRLGPLHPFGIACALAFFAWDWAIMRQAVRSGFDRDDFRICTLWLYVSGTFFAWWIDAVFYRAPGQEVLSTLFAFQGFSSTGAIVGATVGAVVWSRVRIARDEGRLVVARRAEPLALLPLSEVVLSTWPVGFALGRLGCALIHDHPGVTVAKGTLGSLFALAWPIGPDDGVHHVVGPLHVVTGGSGARFDLGFLECVLLAGMAIAFARSWSRPVRLGRYTIAACLIYGPIRFALDFLRPLEGPGAEPRFVGLTFAQYFAIAVVALGLGLLVWTHRAFGARAPTVEPLP